MKKGTILAIDVGTSSLKSGIYDQSMKCLGHSRATYSLETPNNNQVQIDPEKWWKGFLKAAKKLQRLFRAVEIISLSAASPGLTAMDKKGKALYPSILHMDRRSVKQAKRIRQLIGEDKLFKITGNLPFPGGCSGTSILWLRDNFPEVYKKTEKFGHTNTFFTKRLTGNWGIDPSNASLTSLYNTNTYGGWNEELTKALDIQEDKLPPIIQSSEIVGKLSKEISRLTGLKSGIPVCMGGNDAACAALSAGVTNHGQILNVTGTSEILNTCLEKPYPSRTHNLRTHVIPDRWLILFILNAGGKAIEWFFYEFCRDMNKKKFYKEYLPKVMAMKKKNQIKYTPFLSGDRYSLWEKRTSFSGLSLNTTREDLLFSIIQGIVSYMHSHLNNLRKEISLSSTIYFTGGGAESMFMEFKRKFFPEFDFVISDGGSLHGAAMLAQKHLN